MATAYAALVSLQNNLDLIQKHPRHSFSFDNKQMESLYETTSFLIDFIESYDITHGAGRVETADALFRQIACAAHAAEDVMESHVVDQVSSGSTLSGKRNTTSRFLLDVQKVIEDMAYVWRKSMLHAKKDQINAFKAVPPNSSTTVTSDKNAMVGFDDAFVHLMDLLTGEPSSLLVIPIVGTGGIGKTTIARKAYSHPLILQHFDVCNWATISQHYAMEDILLQLLSQRRNSNSETCHALGVQSHQSLYCRKYLLILDDMWSVETWDELKFFFPDTDNGSRIILTSRLSDLTVHFGSLSLAMNFLNEGKSWDLFCEKAFTEKVCPPELEEMGKKIVEKCKGLPLAIVVVGGHLRKSPRTQEYWENAANQYMNSTLNIEENEELFNILSLSYSYLPICLKPCFLHIGTFREDEEIFVSDLIKLWVADGFLKPNGTHSLEEVAEDYVNKLIDRNLILAHGRSWNGKVRSCKIHDILRELCLKIAAKEKFLCVLHTPRAILKERRVVTNVRIPEELHYPRMFHALRSATLVRSLKCEGGRLLFDLKLLRVLHKVDRAFTDETNFQQVNLRYLHVDLEFNKNYQSFHLPSSISLLWNLQNLIIRGICRPAVIAPYKIWEMLQLRHVEVDRICLPGPPPMMSDGLDQENDLVLPNLQTLFEVENFSLSEEVCRRIPNIKVLFITYNDYDELGSYYCPHNLGRFHKLESLACSFGFDSKWRDVASNLTFPSSLTMLALTNSRLDWDELTTTVGSLPHLANLGLYENSVTGSEWTPLEGKFICLKTLTIWGCHELVSWNANDTHFPVIENLFLIDLPELVEFPSGIGEIPTLKHIDLSSCSMSLAISAIRMMAEEEKQGNEGFGLSISFGDDRGSLESFNNELQDEGLTRDRLYLYYIAGRPRACDKLQFYSSLTFTLR